MFDGLKRLRLDDVDLGSVSAQVRVRRPAADVREASRAALARGGVVVPHPFLADASQHIWEDIRGWCERPIALRQEGECHFREVTPRGVDALLDPSRTLVQFVQCRKCAGCRRWKRAMWSGRAALEFVQSHRTWLGTLTFGPEERYRVVTLARRRVPNFDTLTLGERFRELLRELQPHVRLFLMRLRKGQAKAQVPPMEFRYLVASEPHKDGFPHFHILLHEQKLHAGVGRRQLEAQWRDCQSGIRLGHASFKLVRDVGGARYAAKYLGKYDADRVQCSLHYGRRDGAPVLIVPALGGVLATPLASSHSADDE